MKACMKEIYMTLACTQWESGLIRPRIASGRKSPGHFWLLKALGDTDSG